MSSSALSLASNLSASQLAALTSAIGQPVVQGGYADADLIAIEAKGGHEELSDAQIAAITERVRQGAALLLTLSEGQQLTSTRLGSVLPAITWQTADRGGNVQPIAIGDQDLEFFSAESLLGRALPYAYTVEPITAVERGQSRYAIYQRKNPVLRTTEEPGHQLWTRPLLMRDVRVRLRGNDHFTTPLLVTGRYGAGRTVLFGSGFDSLTASMLPAIAQWMKITSVVPVATPFIAPELEIEYGAHSIVLHLVSKASADVPVEVVGRAYTWENAPVGLEHDLLQSVVLVPGKRVTLEMPLPAPSETNLQAIQYRDAFRVRIAVLGSAGATTLVERQIFADFSTPVKLRVMADDIDRWSYPFHAPGTRFQRLFGERMGASVGAYAYPPGSRADGAVTIANGLRDLNPLAVVTDETTPGNPAASCLVDGAMVANRPPIDSVVAYSVWTGKAGVDNTLTFTFPHAVTLACITLVGSVVRNVEGNPDAVSVQLDGRRLISAANLPDRFKQGSGKALLEFEPAMGTRVTMTFPSPSPVGTRRRRVVSLTEIQFEGWTGAPPKPVSGDLAATLEDALTGESLPVMHQSVSLRPGERRVIALPCTLPQSEMGFYRLQASFDGQTDSSPVMVLEPRRPMLPYSDLVPTDGPSLGLIVTEGFRACFPLGSGVEERTPGSWASPDDLIWAYSRQMKEVSAKARTAANRLYVTEGDMRHYASPWRTFSNGVPLYDEATPNLVEGMSKQPRWKESKVVQLSHSDRWETGPQVETLHGWQDFVEFDAHLRASGKPGLTGKTRMEIANEIHEQHEDAWQAWQLGQYLHNLRTVREGFAAQGKRLLITAQGLPLIAGAVGAEVAETVQASSDDHTWGMAERSPTLTTGRQLAELAYNPVWKMSTLLQYGFVSSILNNPEWHVPISTLEPLRRYFYERAWRATVWPDGRYGSVYTAGYPENVGISYQLNENDWNEWFRIEERHSLLSPEEPIGAGLVISTIRFADPNHIRFSGDDILSSNDALSLARVFQRLHEAGLSIPFGANVSALAQWKGSAPLIILNPEVFAEEEIATLEVLQKRGVRMAAFTGATSLPPRTAALFSRPGSLIHSAPTELTALEATQLAPHLRTLLQIPLELPVGLCGYGFTMAGMHFVALEDWREEGRVAHVRLRATEGKTTATACELNDHRSVKVQREGADCVVDVPVRSGDGQLIALLEA